MRVEFWGDRLESRAWALVDSEFASALEDVE
jgi:hypothetical protein